MALIADRLEEAAHTLRRLPKVEVQGFKSNWPATINEFHEAYRYYGARGITVCQEWLDDFDAFVLWSLANGFEFHLQLDRIDNYQGYSRSNCRYVTARENMNNLRYHQDRRTALEKP